ncbi:MAG: alkaline phosphatase D family protein [Solirubrobacterales bacterium]|nr:alkaline phosphatase D family protein [Solirubrobacterales bacterium]
MERGVDRRAFIGGAAGLAAGVLISGPGAIASRSGPAGRRPHPLSDVRFSQGVASGQPGERAMTLWTRVDGAGRRGTIRLEVSRDSDFRRLVSSRRVVVDGADNHTAQVRVKGLNPGERYFYRFEAADHATRVGRFTTLPGDSRQPVRIGFFSCQAWEAGYYVGHRGLAREDDLDLLVCLGDYVYERPFYEDDGVRRDRTGENNDGEVQTLPEYRAKYALYHSDANLRQLRARAPMMAIWDDHEVEDNYAHMRPGEATLDRRIKFEKRRRNGYKAFYEHMPFGPAEGERFRLYRSIKLGRTAELFMLDERKYRSDQACDEQIPCPPQERNAEGRTLLGAEQLGWVKRGLNRSRARWKIVANQVMAMALDAPANNPINMDQWDGYGADREELFRFVKAKRIKYVSLLTGDIHTFFAGDVTPTGRLAGEGGAEDPVATEFVGGSMTSRGIVDTIEATTGSPPAPSIQAGLADSAVVRSNNPHIKYAELSRNGYGLLVARDDQLDVRYRSPESVERRRSPIETIARFRVEAGTPQVEVLEPGP